MSNSYALIADIGATNARFAIADHQGFHDPLILQCEDYPGLADAAQDYLERTGHKDKPKAASFAVAAPVIGGDVDITNNPWAFNIPQTKEALGLDYFNVMNDFVAIALAVPHLKAEDTDQITDGTSVDKAPIAIIGAGTGLGVSSVFWTGDKHIAVAAEGGHVTMPAKTQREFDIFRTLRYKYRHVSAERVCSGKGLVNIYNAIVVLDGRDDLPERTPSEISDAAINQTCDACEEALDKMMGFLGTIAGNLALSIGAQGGVYIAGGIPAKLGQYFFDSRFADEFARKGRFEKYLSTIPAYLIKNPYVAFVGLQADLMTQKAV